MERNKAIDSVAGIMITYMVFTHICQHFGYEHSAIYMTLEHIFYFFMPWFFFKAGMFFKFGDNKTICYKGINRLLVPFVKYSLIGHICYCLLCYFNGNIHWSVIFPYRIFLMEGSIPGNLPLWFLLSLFLCRVIFNELQNRKVPIYLVAIISVLVALMLHKIDFIQPFYVANVWTGMFFMTMGYFVKKYNLSTPPILLLSIVIYMLSMIYPSFVGMRSNHLYYGSYLLWIIYSLAGIVSINFLGDYFIKRIEVFAIIGRYSMQIYCMHWILIIFI